MPTTDLKPHDRHTAVDSRGRMRDLLLGDAANPVRIDTLVDDWDTNTHLTPAERDRLHALGDEAIHRRLDQAFLSFESHWWALLDQVRAAATSRLLDDAPPVTEDAPAPTVFDDTVAQPAPDVDPAWLAAQPADVIAATTLEHIAANPELHEQSQWRCESGRCFAGWVAELTGSRWIDNTTFVLTPAGVRMHVSEYVSALLGLSENQADTLFDEDNTLDDLQRLAAFYF